MAQYLLPGGWLAALMGVGLIFPVVVARLEGREPAGLGVVLAAAGCALIAGGVAALVAGTLQRRRHSMPSGVRAAVMANVLFLAFCTLEFSDGFVRQDGRVFYWTSLLFLPALVVFSGLLSARRWAWWTARGLTAAAVLWFVVLVAVIPFGDLRAEGGPVPWYGRVYMIGVSLAFAGIAAGAYASLGRADARGYFGVVRPREIAAAEVR